MKNELSTSCLFVLLVVGSAVGAPSKPTAESCVCDFDSVDLCGWSAEYIEDGWLWSGDHPTTDIPSDGSDFLYITDTSADVYFPYSESGGTLEEVTQDTIFSFNFYLKTDENFENELAIYFEEESNGNVATLAVYYTSTEGWLSTGPLLCTDCCSSTFFSCRGTIHVKTNAVANSKLQAAVDGFSAQELSCSIPPPPPTPPPPPKSCVCEFDTKELCGSSAAYITDGWLWSGEFPTTDIPTDGSEFVYITDASAILYYPYPSSGFTLNDVSSDTTFSFNYYLSMDVNDVNQLEVYFEENGGVVTRLAQYTTSPGAWQTSGPLHCTSCCTTENTCSGTINVQTTYAENTVLYAAVDNIDVFSATCM